jgi:Uma2 family endonuclease
MQDPTTAATPQTVITAEELLEHPEWNPCELVRGKVRAMSPTGYSHGDVAGVIAGMVFMYARGRKAGRVLTAEAGFILSRNPDTVRAPDVMFVAEERMPKGAPGGYLPIPPDLAVEVVSPNDQFSDITAKAEEYLAAGVRLVWVVDPQTRHAYVFRPGQPVRSLSEKEALSGEDVLPDFQLPLSEVFSR